jgi:hypothetical protein
MSETTKLMGVIQRLEEAKIEELKDVVKKLKGFAIELKSYASNDPRSFRIETTSGPEVFSAFIGTFPTSFEVVGAYTNFDYYGLNTDPKITIEHIFKSFFTDTSTFHRTSLQRLAEILDELANILETTLQPKKNNT